MRLALRPVTGEAVEWVAMHLRAADVSELALSHGGMPMSDPGVRLHLLRASVLVSLAGECWAAHDVNTGEPLAVLGVAPCGWIDNDAAPWMLGTDSLSRYGRDLVVQGREAARRWAQRWTLVNRVDARNTAAVRWLTRIGFEVEAGDGMVPFRFRATQTHG